MKKGLITLTALVSIILAIFVIVTLFFALNQYLSVQNVEKLKTLKELSLNAQAMQLLSQDVKIEQRELNYSFSIVDGKIVSDKIEYNFDLFNNEYSFNCNLRLRKITLPSGEIEYARPYPIFVKNNNVFECLNKNER